MRTISQLTFESTTQILLQIRIYLFWTYPDSKWFGKGSFRGGGDDFSVSL